MRKIIFIFLISFSFALNHLANSNSEYLLEHANNPIDWYPWEKDAFDKAKKENKLIFVSIGYSTCHWCRVMLKESFTDKKVANLLNKNYISIKVDKEQNPGIDRYYQQIAKKIYGHYIGWPLNIIMLPDKRIIYITTYIPKNNIFKKKGFLTLLPYFAKLWQKNPKKLISLNKNIQKKLKLKNNINISNILKYSENNLNKNFDFTYGGFKGVHKFPEYNKFKLLLDIYLLTKNQKYLNMLDLTLTNMARSGMVDEVEGGFFRYSTIDDFSIPHFEKMLYSNALMINIYSLTYKYHPKKLYKKSVLNSINWLEKYFKNKDGLFFAASSADSPNEGDYYIFTTKEIYKALKNIPNKKEILDYIHFDKDGNFGENKEFLYFKFKKPPKNLDKFLNNLKKLRKNHKFPFIDKKEILSWNAMMASAYFKASVFNKSYISKAQNLITAIYKNLYKNGFYHYKLKNRLTKKATLEDYAYFLRALIDAYEHTLDKKYLQKAKIISNKIWSFHKNKKWYFDKFPATLSEKSYPSAVSMALNSLLDFYSLKNDFLNYEKTKNIIKKLPVKFEYATLLEDKLKIKYNIYIIKNKNPNIDLKIYYPFYLFKKVNLNFYEICTIYSCLNTLKEENVEKFFKKIKY